MGVVMLHAPPRDAWRKHPGEQVLNPNPRLQPRPHGAASENTLSPFTNFFNFEEGSTAIRSFYGPALGLFVALPYFSDIS